MSDSDVIIRIKRLRMIRKWLYTLLMIFLIIPLIIGPSIIFHLEPNENLNSYSDAFMIYFESITNTKLTDLELVTFGAKLLIGISSFFNLIFFGFIAGIILISIEISVLIKTGR